MMGVPGDEGAGDRAYDSDGAGEEGEETVEDGGVGVRDGR